MRALSLLYDEMPLRSLPRSPSIVVTGLVPVMPLTRPASHVSNLLDSMSLLVARFLPQLLLPQLQGRRSTKRNFVSNIERKNRIALWSVLFYDGIRQENAIIEEGTLS